MTELDIEEDIRGLEEVLALHRGDNVKKPPSDEYDRHPSAP